jgi:hypothetical protein
MSNNGWQIKIPEKKKALRGVATIRATKTGYRVVFANDPSGITYDIPNEKAPENMRTGKWFVSLSNDGTQIYSVNPITGAFVCKLQKFACAEGQLPAPRHYTQQFKNEDGSVGIAEYDAFTAILEIVEPKDFAGLTMAYFLRYNFGELDGIVAFVKPKSKYTTQVYDFLSASGAFDKGDMTFSENILPALEARLKEAGKKLAITIKDGVINSVVQMEAG